MGKLYQSGTTSLWEIVSRWYDFSSKHF